MQQRSLAQTVGPILGLVYLLVGIAGFAVTGFDGFTQNQGDKLLGLHVNPYHNIVHAGAGLFLIIMCLQKNAAAAEGALMGAGLFLLVAFVIGVIAPDNLTIIGMSGEGDLENFNHLIVGATSLAVGLISSGASSASARRRGLA